MKTIIGLGNPGERFELTRHNIGYLVVESLANELDLDFAYDKLLNADICRNSQVIIVKSREFMNESGNTAKKIVRHFGVDLENLLVVHDDTEFSFGEIRVKYAGSSGGHNGIKSIDEAIGNDYWRVRVGIGRPTHAGQELADYVLSNFNREEITEMKPVIDLAREKLVQFLEETIITHTSNAKEKNTKTKS